jgi:hypothetical protein
MIYKHVPLPRPLIIRKPASQSFDATKVLADVPIMKIYVEGQNTTMATAILQVLILEQHDILMDVENNFKKRRMALSQKEDRLQRMTVRQSKMVMEDDE